MKWISCKDRLPNDGDDVLCCDRYKMIYRVKYSNQGYQRWTYVLSNDEIYISLRVGEITHWMPLPEPPKQNESWTEQP